MNESNQPPQTPDNQSVSQPEITSPAQTSDSPPPQPPAKGRFEKLYAVLSIGFLCFSLVAGFVLSARLPKEAGKPASEGVSFAFGEQEKDGIAVVKIYGMIQTSDSNGNIFNDKDGSDDIVQQLKDLGKNKHVKAVVLRLNTPGGTVGASQEIYAEVLKLKDKGIKIVASMADTCASGGVYVAVAADKILANPGTVTGSVGVIFSVPNLRELLGKAGITTNTMKSGKFKDIGSMSRDMSEEEKSLLQGIVDSTYGQFLDAVAKGRNLARDSVKVWADGRVFNGAQALEYKLVDQLGTYEDAILEAQKLASLPEPHIIKGKTSPWEQFQLSLKSIFNPLADLKSILPMTSAPILYYYNAGGL